ncbi:MAG TPA: AbrB/MazE/SpoVT family DNA-binding domain-containing protein [bacterium]|jgi:antitoxin MazE|nr:AbrB/MazE/SpoVT family DNA-binding domain-containing protein [bacterium]HNW16364.1 AbrB/MazE/SpoVT family DNA-binding domain-containing protein [bacterium]HNZ52907.1 AbrB/MazE/SpoVT family DNA-binding domain-containing protein [bacterium]HOB70788.1 AbrB/MazE/SpoVT family DNA-binding domain-containing protein [bacterium]HOG43077.1 AbrB/MazE/SpoVT family DNA-binding domain-containing protein [bacterium]
MIKIMRWGNSLALRLPKAFLESLNLMEGSFVKIRTEKNRIIIEPQNEMTLEEMVLQISSENLHAEVSTGVAKGNEAW